VGLMITLLADHCNPLFDYIVIICRLSEVLQSEIHVYCEKIAKAWIT